MDDKTLESTLLEGWEEVYRMGQLTLWVMLALQDGPKHMAAIKQYISMTSGETITPDEQSLYRSLRRYCQAEMISFELRPSTAGPERKEYKLTDIGERVLQSFIERNLKPLYQSTNLKNIFNERQQ